MYLYHPPTPSHPPSPRLSIHWYCILSQEEAESDDLFNISFVDDDDIVPVNRFSDDEDDNSSSDSDDDDNLIIWNMFRYF